ncbi:hypothetical protein Tco_1074347 [Tanacetum coccineum]
MVFALLLSFYDFSKCPYRDTVCCDDIYSCLRLAFPPWRGVTLKDTGFELTAFSDSDHAGCLDSHKSTSGGLQFLGGDKLVCWSSKKQDCTSMSSTEAVYVSLSACYIQVLWLRTQLINYGFHFDKIPMYCDSKAAIAISCNPIQHFRTKHIDVRYHFIKEHVEKGSNLYTQQPNEFYDIPEVIRCIMVRLIRPYDPTRTRRESTQGHSKVEIAVLRSYALNWKPCQGDSLNLPDHTYKRRCCSLVPAKSDSLPHADAQAFKVKHSAS